MRLSECKGIAVILLLGDEIPETTGSEKKVRTQTTGEDGQSGETFTVKGRPSGPTKGKHNNRKGKVPDNKQQWRHERCEKDDSRERLPRPKPTTGGHTGSGGSGGTEVVHLDPPDREGGRASGSSTIPDSLFNIHDARALWKDVTPCWLRIRRFSRYKQRRLPKYSRRPGCHCCSRGRSRRTSTR